MAERVNDFMSLIFAKRGVVVRLLYIACFVQWRMVEILGRIVCSCRLPSRCGCRGYCTFLDHGSLQGGTYAGLPLDN